MHRLIQLIDDLGTKLELDGDSKVMSAHSLVLAVRKVNGTNFSPTSVDIFDTDNVQVTQCALKATNDQDGSRSCFHCCSVGGSANTSSIFISVSLLSLGRPFTFQRM